MPELNIGGNKITEISLGGNTITEAWLGGNKVYDVTQLETNTVTCSFDTTGLSGVRVTDLSGNTITSLVVNQGSTAQFELRPLNSNYNSFTNVNQGSADESDADLSGIAEQLVSGNLRYTVTAVNTLTENQMATITVTGTLDKKSIIVALDRVDNIPGSNHTTVVDTSLTGLAGDDYSFTDQTITANTGYKFTSGPTWKGASLTGTYPTSDTTITRTVTGTVAKLHTASFSVTNNITGGSKNIAYTISNETQSNQTGTNGQSYSFITPTVNVSSGYAFSSGPSVTGTLSGTFSNSIGNVTVTATISGTVYQKMVLSASGGSATTGSITLVGSVASSGAAATSAGFYYQLVADGASAPSAATLVSSGTKVTDTPSGGTGSMTETIDITSSVSQRDLYYVTWGTNSNETNATSAVHKVDVPAVTISKPSVTTNANTSIGQTGLTMNGTVTNLGNAASATTGFFYGTSSNFGTYNSTLNTYSNATKVTAKTVNSANEAFSSTLTGLSSGTTYYVRAWASNSAGANVGSSVNSTTQSAITTYAQTLAMASNQFQACGLAANTTYYTDNSNFQSSTKLWTNSSGTTNAPTGFYSNGTIVRYWTGLSFGSTSLCL